MIIAEDATINAKTMKHAVLPYAYSQYRFRRTQTTAVVVASLVNPQKHAALVLALMLWVPTHRTAELAENHVVMAKYARMVYAKILVL
jgi:hypothetical protein